MKKKVIVLAAALMLLMVGVVSAAAQWGTFEGYNIVRLVIDGKTVAVNDTPPVILKGRTMVPLSMLKEAGLEATWNKDNYTVNISTNNSVEVDINDTKNIALLANYFKRLEDTGETLTHVTSSFEVVRNAYYLGTDPGVTINDAYESLDIAIDSYNFQQEKAQDMYDIANELGYDSDIINTILNKYFDTIEYYKSSLEYLEKLTVGYSKYNYDNYYNFGNEGMKLNYEAMELSYKEYDKYMLKLVTGQ